MELDSHPVKKELTRFVDEPRDHRGIERFGAVASIPLLEEAFRSYLICFEFFQDSICAGFNQLEMAVALHVGKEAAARLDWKKYIFKYPDVSFWGRGWAWGSHSSWLESPET